MTSTNTMEVVIWSTNNRKKIVESRIRIGSHILQLDDVLVEHRECEAFASGKVPVEAALTDAGRAGDQAERSSKTLSGEHLTSC